MVGVYSLVGNTASSDQKYIENAHVVALAALPALYKCRIPSEKSRPPFFNESSQRWTGRCFLLQHTILTVDPLLLGGLLRPVASILRVWTNPEGTCSPLQALPQWISLGHRQGWRYLYPLLPPCPQRTAQGRSQDAAQAGQHPGSRSLTRPCKRVLGPSPLTTIRSLHPFRPKTTHLRDLGWGART